MNVQLTASEVVLVATSDSIEQLQEILEHELGLPTTYSEAFTIGQSLIGLYAVFSEDGELEGEQT